MTGSSSSIQERWTNKLQAEHVYNEEGNPTGGSTRGVGLEIKWQDGPLGWDYERNTYPEGVEPNGAFIEDVILAAIDRLRFFQGSKFSCQENAFTLTHLEEALMWMQRRHDVRVNRGVQGDHKE